MIIGNTVVKASFDSDGIPESVQRIRFYGNIQ